MCLFLASAFYGEPVRKGGKWVGGVEREAGGGREVGQVEGVLQNKLRKKN